MNTFDVVVVGNGILGLTAAYFLKKEEPTLSVAVVGKNEREGSASLAAGAMLNLWAEVNHGQFENEALSQRFDLTRQGVAAWPKFAEELSDLIGEKVSVKKGTYVLRTLKSTQVEERNFSYLKASLKKFAIEHKELSQADIPWIKPSQCSRTIEALWVPDGAVDSRVVIASLDKALEKLGVVRFNDNASELKIKKGGVKEHQVILEKSTELSGAHIVLANGAYAQALIDPHPLLRNTMPRLLFGSGSGADLTVPDWIYKYGGLGKEILDLTEVIRTTDRGGACGVHLVPYGNGKFYAGASSQVSLEADKEPKMHGVHALVHSLIYEFHRTFFHVGVSLRGNGFRPTSADCFPMIGESEVEGIWLLNGTKRDGLSMSAHISKEFAKAILKKQHTLPSLFTPSRPLISYKTKEEAIHDTELMFIGADFHHGGGVLTPYLVDPVAKMRGKSIEDIYQKRSLENFGIHPEIIHLYENDEFYSKINNQRSLVKKNGSFLSSLANLIKPKKGSSR